MTKAEYNAAFRAARNRVTYRTATEIKTLQAVYKAGAEAVAARVADAELRGLSQFTINSQAAINQQLEAEAAKLATLIERQIPEAISRQYTEAVAPIDITYIYDAAKDAGADGKITKAGLSNMAVRVNTNLVAETVSRQSGSYTFSQSIWNTWKLSDKTGFRIPTGIFGDYQTRVKYIIDAGLAQGRDPVKIADDITTYVRNIGKENGAEAVFNPGRYGKLVPGSRAYAQRIPSRIDWRALRLVRSELYASIQSAGARQAAFNPACTGSVNWKKMPGNPIDCCPEHTNNGKRCIDLQADSPYPADNPPVYNHANCGCWLEPILQNKNEFVADLKSWIDAPDSRPYLQDWYNGQYLPAQISS